MLPRDLTLVAEQPITWEIMSPLEGRAANKPRVLNVLREVKDTFGIS